MKNLLTLFLTTLTALSFAQQPTTHPLKKFKFAPNTPTPAELHHRLASSAGLRSSGACDTVDFLDYNTYAEINTQTNGITYTGSLNGTTPQPYVQEVSSTQLTIAAADAFVYSYVVAVFDSLAFSNYSTSSEYSKTRSSSTVTLDTLNIYMSISGDTIAADGKMTNDSIVFKLYSTNASGVVSATPVQTFSYVGYAGLSPFFTGADHITLAQIPVNYTFNQGQGFAVRMDYYNFDTSSHCFICYGYADSCQTLTYQSQTFPSLAYPSPFSGGNTAIYKTYPGNTFAGEIDSTAPTTATARDISNVFGIFGAPYNFPPNCAYVYVQNLQIIPMVNVVSTLGVTIAGSNPLTLACPTSSHALALTKTGDYAGATYTWSSNIVSSLANGNATIFNPGTYSVTVTNSQGCQATDQLVASYAGGLTQSPTFTAPDTICAGRAALFTNTSPDTTGYTSSWAFGQGSGSTLTNPSFTYTAQGSFPVTLTIDSAGCKFNYTQTVTVQDPAGPYCVSGIQDVAFDHAVSIVPNPSNGNINITVSDVDKNVTITIYNLIGETVKYLATTESPAVFNKTIDLNNLANGTYLVKIQSGSRIATKKLVITK